MNLMNELYHKCKRKEHHSLYSKSTLELLIIYNVDSVFFLSFLILGALGVSKNYKNFKKKSNLLIMGSWKSKK